MQRIILKDLRKYINSQHNELKLSISGTKISIKSIKLPDNMTANKREYKTFIKIQISNIILKALAEIWFIKPRASQIELNLLFVLKII